MAAVVEEQCSLVLLLLHQCGDFGVCASGGGRYARVHIPQHPLHLKSRRKLLHDAGSLVGCLHVNVVVSVVAEEHRHILPCTRILLVHVAYRLVHHYLGGIGGRYGETAHGNVVFVGLRFCRRRSPALSVVEGTEVSVVHNVLY